VTYVGNRWRRSGRGLYLLAGAVVAAGIVAGGAAWAVSGSSRSAKPGGTSGEFPSSIYPPPASFPDWGVPSGCPSLSGLRGPGANPTEQILPGLSRFGHVSENEDLHLSDRALWPVVRQYWNRPPSVSGVAELTPGDVISQPAAKSEDADAAAKNCGRRTTAKSWAIAVCPRRRSGDAPCSPRQSPGLTEHLLLLNRRGHWLIWFMRP